MNNRTKAIFEMLICATLWSIGGIFIKLLPWNGFAVASLRSLISGLVILIYIRMMRYPIIVNRQTVLSGCLTGCVYLCFVIANKLTTAANAIVLQFTSPIFVLLYSALFFHAKIEKRDAVTVVITLFGIILCFLDGLQGGYLLGNIIAITAGLFMAGMYVCLGNLEKVQRFSAAFFGQCFTAIVGFPWVIATHPVLNGATISYVLILGIFQLGISYVLYVRASEFCPPIACCLLGVLEPLLNPVWVMIFDGETPGPFSFIGGLVVLITITVWCATGNKEKTA